MHLKVRILFALIILLPIHKASALDSEETSILYENNYYTIQEILSKYIQIESLSGNEFEAGEFLKKICAENGLIVTSMGEENGNYNFAASIRPLQDKLPNIIFLNHIDIVPAGNIDKWEFPPFSGAITESEIWGRGAYDNKGVAIMQLFSIIEIAKRYSKKSMSYNVTFLPVSCEETQCEGGIKYVIDNYLDILNPEVVIGEGAPAIKGLLKKKPDLALFGISVAQKRALWIQLKLELKTSGHSSVTPLEYANKEMVLSLNNLLKKKPKMKYNQLNVNLLKQLGQLNKGLTGFVLKHPKLFKPIIVPKLRQEPVLMALFSNTITLTSLNDGNKKFNVIPENVTAILDCRLLPEESTAKFLTYVKKTLNNSMIKIEIIKETPHVKETPINSIHFNNLNTAIQQNYAGSKTAPILLPNINDTSYFRKVGVTSFSVVPVKLDRKYLESIHNYNERIPKDILEKGKDTYLSFIELSLN